MKNLITASALILAVCMPLHGNAQSGTDQARTSSPPSTSMTDGEIRKIDPSTGKITIKHEEIKHMDMPGMTMVFTAKDKKLLSGWKTGDRIKFMVVNEGGKMIITEIRPSP